MREVQKAVLAHSIGICPIALISTTSKGTEQLAEGVPCGGNPRLLAHNVNARTIELMELPAVHLTRENVPPQHYVHYHCVVCVPNLPGVRPADGNWSSATPKQAALIPMGFRKQKLACVGVAPETVHYNRANHLVDVTANTSSKKHHQKKRSAISKHHLRFYLQRRLRHFWKQFPKHS